MQCLLEEERLPSQHTTQSIQTGQSASSASHHPHPLLLIPPTPLMPLRLQPWPRQRHSLPITNKSTVTQGNFNIQDCIYPHGLTPPLHHVQKRRFRKRLNKRTIETVERAVERLLEEDGRAGQVIIDIVDNVRDLSDSEGEDYQPPQSATVGFGNQPPSKIVYNKARPSISHTKRSSSQPFNPHGHHHQQQRHDKRAKDL
ncbi:hypothetical protein PTTG_30055 [Puccinia triticina 1-1 BBBD Race 1]|uniref:TAFII55_N domain-containing protein n=1 Tax=Puccinia triticina (isolate 1-1 / race 1 (BBBD)) TaxID=630390 RepID=A0A180G0M4_PUCT1|nr:hypothetical protein PTTG_30055 [Puccinia triticina 1-1 BBBD Race 1]